MKMIWRNLWNCRKWQQERVVLPTAPVWSGDGLAPGRIAAFVDRLPRYHQMIKTLDADDGDLHGDQQYTMDRPYNDLCKARKEYRFLLDYVFIRNQGGPELNVFREVKIMRKQWHKDHQDLSDHYGLEAIISNLSNPN